MKLLNKKKLIITIGMLGLTSIGNAQWAVTNVNDPLYFGPTGIFTQMMGQMQNTVKASIDQVSALGEIARKQDAQMQEDTDRRMREAMGSANIAAYNMSLVPTIQACAEYTQRGAGAAAVRSAMSGGGGSNKYSSPGKASAEIRSDAIKQGALIANKKNLGTCSAEDIAGKVAGCTGAVGDFGGSVKTPAGDVTSLSIKANMSNSQKMSVEQDYANLTMNAQAQDVANQYIKNATLYNAPKVLPDDKLQKTPAYKAMYDAVMTKLNSSQQVMVEIMSTRKESAGFDPSSLAGKYWQENATAYKNLLGMNPPANPSFTELLNFSVTNDYFGIPKNTAMSEQDLLKELNRRAALNNLIAYKQLSNQENTNILLALLLTQATTPAPSPNEMDGAYNEAMNK